MIGYVTLGLMKPFGGPSATVGCFRDLVGNKLNVICMGWGRIIQLWTA